MIPPTPPLVDFPYGNVGNQPLDSGPPFSQAWDVVSLSIARIFMT